VENGGFLILCCKNFFNISVEIYCHMYLFKKKVILNPDVVTDVAVTPVLPSAGNTGIQGEIKLSIQYKHDALHVMIMHVKDLVSWESSVVFGTNVGL
jgi:hypothetical protein